MSSVAAFAYEPVIPLMIALALPVADGLSTDLEMGAMTKYKTFTGEEINGQKVWNYDFHDDDH